MTAFAELDWGRIDVVGIVANGGVATVDVGHREACTRWLQSNGYRVDSLDATEGWGPLSSGLNRVFRWREQFGYELSEERRPGLDAVRDGIVEFEVVPGEGRVLELLGAERLWADDAEWLLRFISIAQEQCRTSLALGARFFLLIVLASGSPLVGVALEPDRIPAPRWGA